MERREVVRQSGLGVRRDDDDDEVGNDGGGEEEPEQQLVDDRRYCLPLGHDQLPASERHPLPARLERHVLARRRRRGNGGTGRCDGGGGRRGFAGRTAP